jgi:hypothetical protein
MMSDPRTESAEPGFLIRIQLIDGSIESFVPADAAEAQRIWEEVDPARLFTRPRLVLAGEYTKSVFVSSQIVRLDFIQRTYACWEFPGGYSDVVELSEAEFRRHAHLGQPSLMAKRKSRTPVGDLLVSFLKLYMAGGRPVFLMVEIPVKLPVESHSFMQFLLAGGGFHMRLSEGGIGIVNLAHLAGYTAYPGVAQIPANTWMTEPVPNEQRKL